MNVSILCYRSERLVASIFHSKEQTGGGGVKGRVVSKKRGVEEEKPAEWQLPTSGGSYYYVAKCDPCVITAFPLRVENSNQTCGSGNSIADHAEPTTSRAIR
ncbi:hypothetical protein ACTXT7_006898 [Hymenolepis weldensis]